MTWAGVRHGGLGIVRESVIQANGIHRPRSEVLTFVRAIWMTCEGYVQKVEVDYENCGYVQQSGRCGRDRFRVPTNVPQR